VETAARLGPTALSLAQALQKRVKSLGNHVANLEARNKNLAKALAAIALAPPYATVEEKFATVNARVTAVISRFEAYIHAKATGTQPPTPT
jgi:hypothetical protein